MRKLITLLLVFTMLFAVVACGNEGTKQEEKPAEDTQQEAEAPAEGEEPAAEAEGEIQTELKAILDSEPTSLDSGKAADNYAIQIIMATQEPLIMIYNDENENIQYTNEGAAESWEVSDDGLTYTFHLRDNKWSDGEPVVAEHYRYGILRNLDPATGCPYAYFLTAIEGGEEFNAGTGSMEDVKVEAPDDKTLVITLSEITPHFLAVLGNPVTYAQRQDLIEEVGHEAWGSEADKMVYNGAHKVESWVHNSEIVLVKNENYWNADNIKLERIERPIITDFNTAMNMFYTGEVLSAGTNMAEWRQKFEELDNVVHKQVQNPQTFFMFFNTKDDVFQNVKVRQAFSAALDREDFNNVIWSGNNQPATGWIPNQIFVDTINYQDRAPNFVEDLKNEIGDLRAHLSEGLEELGMDPNPENLEVSIMLGSTDQWFKNFGEYLQQHLKTVLGVTLNVQQYDWPIFSDHLNKSDYQIGYMAWGSETAEPYALMSLHVSTSNSIGHGWANEEYDKLIAEAEHEQDPEKRLDLYLQAEKILMTEVPVSPVVFSVSNAYAYTNLHNIDYCPFGNVGYRRLYVTK